jgi:hypothetical protein
MTLSQADQVQIRSGAIRTVLEKTDRILGSAQVEVEISTRSYIPAPAYTDGQRITINATMNPVQDALHDGFDQRSMLLITGLNYHELAHVKFTPRLTSKYVRDIKETGMFETLNILEDQAAETRFVQLYEPARHYFTALVTDYLMLEPAYLANNYVLISGRKFLPAGLREIFRSSFTRPHILDEVDELVAAYKALTYPGDIIKMRQVVDDFHHLIHDLDHAGVHAPHSELTKGAPDRSVLRRLKDRDEFVNDQTEQDDSAARRGATTDPGTSPGDQDAETRDQDAGAGTTQADPTAEADRGPGTEAPPGDALGDALGDAQRAALEEVEQELNDRLETVRDQEADYRVALDPDASALISPLPAYAALVQRCVDEFRHLQMQHAPGWHPQQRSGKLDPRRFVSALRGTEEVYRRWNEGVNDALDYEVVFLLDQSGSMSSKISTASVSLWILKRTFEETGGVVTVLGFHDTVELLSQRGDLARVSQIPIYTSKGSTFVGSALSEARRIMSVSRKPLKLVVVITDGIFHDTRDALSRLRSMDVPIAMVGIKHDLTPWRGTENVVLIERIEDPSALVGLVKNLALRLSDERLTRRGT